MRERLLRLLLPREPDAALPPRGLHHFTREVDGQVARYHLRIEPDGRGLLIANATNAAQLAPSGTALAFELLRGEPEEAKRRARRAFRIGSDARLDDDIAKMRETLDDLARSHGGYPLIALSSAGESGALPAGTLSAPLSADVVVADLAPTLGVLSRLWTAAIPHVVLVVEREAGPHLVRLVERAEDLGMICGVRTRATDIAKEGLLEALAMAGLDHLDLYLASAERDAHDTIFGAGDHARVADAVRRCHELELCPTAVTPLLVSTLGSMDEIAEALASGRVPAWTLYAIADASGGGGRVLGPDGVRQAASTAEELADHHDLNLVWSPPIARDERVSLAEQARRGPRVANGASIRVERDGELPAMSARPTMLDRCDACPGLALCAEGCPADPATWSRVDGGGR